MLIYIPGNLFDSNPLRNDILRFRHRHFVERFGWEALRKPDFLERDQFDDDDAIHMVLLDDHSIVGYTRLLTTTGPHLLSHVYPEVAAGNPYPTGPDVYEWTRCVAEPEAKISGILASNILLTGVLEFCLVSGIRALIVETHPKLMNLLVSTGWDVEPFAAPCTYSGSLVVPICARPLHSALEINRRLYGIEGTVLALNTEDELTLDRGPLPAGGGVERWGEARGQAYV